jgi:hypothetical protein
MVGPVPRTGGEDQPAPELAEPERLMAAKYFDPAHQAAGADGTNRAAGGGPAHQAADTAPGMVHDGRHAWLRITPDKIVSWDFRKLATLPDRSPESGG